MMSNPRRPLPIFLILADSTLQFVTVSDKIFE
jgi:hypothetical protein